MIRTILVPTSGSETDAVILSSHAGAGGSVRAGGSLGEPLHRHHPLLALDQTPRLQTLRRFNPGIPNHVGHCHVGE